MWIFDKLDSWKDALLMVVIGFLPIIILAIIYVFGSKIPKKNE